MSLNSTFHMYHQQLVNFRMYSTNVLSDIYNDATRTNYSFNVLLQPLFQVIILSYRKQLFK